MTSKTLSNGTLSLRFMQNAHRAKLQAQVELEQAKIKDDAEWSVPSRGVVSLCVRALGKSRKLCWRTRCRKLNSMKYCLPIDRFTEMHGVLLTADRLLSPAVDLVYYREAWRCPRSIFRKLWRSPR